MKVIYKNKISSKLKAKKNNNILFLGNTNEVADIVKK